jgi:hypothetical protein
MRACGVDRDGRTLCHPRRPYYGASIASRVVGHAGCVVCLRCEVRLGVEYGGRGASLVASLQQALPLIAFARGMFADHHRFTWI